MAKVKNLKKRIRRLEARLQKGAQKLAKLKRKLEAAATVTAAKTKAASTASVEKARKISNASASIQKKRRRAALKADVKPGSTVKEPRVARKKKRKLNLTPERRAQLAAAMKARWAAKRAAAAVNAQNSSFRPGFSPGDASEPQ
jgi:hypothetical protein